MSQLRHKTILQFHKFVSNGKLLSSNGKEKKATYGVLELSTGGELFSILFNTASFEKNLSLFYVK